MLGQRMLMGRQLIESETGTFGETVVNTRGLGIAAGVQYGGFFFTVPAGMTEIRSVSFYIGSSPAGTFHAEIWSVSGNNPNTQIGGDSDSVSAGSGENAYPFGTAIPVTPGAGCFVVLVGETSSNGNFDTVADSASYGSDRDNSAITNLDKTADIDGFGEQWRCKIVGAG